MSFASSKSTSFVVPFMICLAGLLLTGCRTSRYANPTLPHMPDYENVDVGKGDKRSAKVIAEALEWIGTPYKYAGQDKGVGTDCSGLVMKVYFDVLDWKLPRNSAKQAEFCTRIDSGDVKRGDLVFFATGKDPEKVTHVGIVVDDETFIHASSSKGVVVSRFDNPYYRRTFIMFGRIPYAQ